MHVTEESAIYQGIRGLLATSALKGVVTYIDDSTKMNISCGKHVAPEGGASS